MSVALGLFIVGALSTAAAVSPTFCAVCHGSYADGLEATAHAGLACGDCHDGSTYFQTLERRVAVAEMVFKKVIPGGLAPAGHVFNDQCVQCHDSDIAETVTDGVIRMSHRAPVEADWSCTKCHEATGHSVAAAATGVYTMETCLSCHSANPGNAATCEICHVEAPQVAQSPDEVPEGAEPDSSRDGARTGRLSTPWEVTHGPDSSRLHGMGDLSVCSSCHIGQFCASCHGLDLPHPPTYLDTHGSVVVAGEVASDTCHTCHEPAACDTCHQVEMPHRSSFLTEHADDVRADGEQVCRRCHSEESCLECHARHVHPGVPKDVLDQLRSRPVS